MNEAKYNLIGYSINLAGVLVMFFGILGFAAMCSSAVAKQKLEMEKIKHGCKP
jgi:hypothetical protein